MLQRTVNFYSGPGLRLTGIMALPDVGQYQAKALPAVVLCHGPGGYGDPEAMGPDTLMPRVSEWLTKAGFAALTMRYRGVRGSEGPANRLIPMEQVEDIRNAITFVQQQPEVNAELVGLFGAMTGASNVTYAAGIDQRVKCVVAVSTVANMGRWFRGNRRYWEWVDFMAALQKDRAQRVMTGVSTLVPERDVANSDPRTVEYVATAPQFKGPPRVLSLESAEAMANFCPEEVVDRISPRAAMWIVAENDTLVPVAESQTLYEKAGEPKRLVIIKGAIHHRLYHSPDFDRVMESALEWFNGHLRSH